MTPKEKAKELVDIFINVNYLKDYEGMHYPLAKECALIAVDEILNSTPSKTYWHTYDDETPSAIIYWEEVKQEIELL